MRTAHPPIVLAAASVLLTIGSPRARVVVPPGTLSESTTWRRGHTYYLTGVVRVAAAATLTIEAGARIEAAAGSAIVVSRTARLRADGTLLQPIVFTCEDAVPAPGCWDGIVIQGNAPINIGTPTSPPARGNGAAGCLETTDAVSSGQYGGCDTLLDVADHVPDFGTLSSITSFGQDARGELYVTLGGGNVYRVVP